MTRELISITLSDLVAVSGLLTFLFGICLWVGSKFFATRADLHEIKNSLTTVYLSGQILNNDVKWIKNRLGCTDPD